MEKLANVILFVLGVGAMGGGLFGAAALIDKILCILPI